MQPLLLSPSRLRQTTGQKLNHPVGQLVFLSFPFSPSFPFLLISLTYILPLYAVGQAPTNQIPVFFNLSFAAPATLAFHLLPKQNTVFFYLAVVSLFCLLATTLADYLNSK